MILQYYSLHLGASAQHNRVACNENVVSMHGCLVENAVRGYIWHAEEIYGPEATAGWLGVSECMMSSDERLD
jgi:hypothetical protein